MSPVVIGFVALFFLVVAYLVIQTRRAGPPQLTEGELESATVVASATRDAPGPGWTELGSKTTADGLRLRFDHDDDPQAEALFPADPGGATKTSSLAHKRTVRLGADPETHHVHTRGYVFRVRMHGTGAVIGKQVQIQMRVAGDGTPIGGQIENDDDTDAAVGDWIEIEKVEILRVR